MSSYERIYAVIKRIPKGRVATYGQIARLAGLANHARQVGYALSALPQHLDRQIAWHRVVNANGEISARSDPHFEVIQRRRLQKEGVRFDSNGRIPMGRFQWKRRRARMVPVIARRGKRPAPST